ncbi:MAG TPA: hypothetical protein ENF60_01765 [Candidatus Omnitrophica bacterium]|nr:hypothetical protein [Candidatus Omnitrophota bacterium]
MKKILSVLSFMVIVGIFILFAYSKINAATNTLGDKIQLALKKQDEINNKLKEVEELLNQVRIRVYRRSGFYGR